MNSEITVEYVGLADRWAGPGVVHTVRAFWNARDGHSEAEVAARGKRALVTQGNILDHAEYIGRDLDTFKSPSLAAILRYRVLTPTQEATRKELSTRVYKTCDGCGGDHPGQLVRMAESGAERPLCFGCWNPIKSACKVLHWIKKDGKLQLF
jgi:hypothetical protein